MTDVLVLGGGFGGLAAATTLRSRLAASDTVTLVASSDRFYMGFAKLWDLAGARPLAEGSAPLDGLEARGIRFVRTEITAIDAAACAVETAAGTLAGDGLVVALGAGDAPPHLQMLQGADAFNLYDAAALAPMRAAITGLAAGRIVVAILGAPYKCPPAPYEAALVVHELIGDRAGDVEVVVTTPQPMSLPSAGPDASRFLVEQLRERGIDVRTEHPVKSVDAAARTIAFGNDETVTYDVLLGVPAVAPPAVLASSGLAGPSGFVHPDPRTLATAVERVYAVGDCTVVPTPAGQLPKAGVFAAAQGEVAAANLAADLGAADLGAADLGADDGGSGGGGDRATFDGYGYCFLELPGRRVAFVEGNFLADPPDVHLTEATSEAFARKETFERERLAAWLG